MIEGIVICLFQVELGYDAVLVCDASHVLIEDADVCIRPFTFLVLMYVVTTIVCMRFMFCLMCVYL